MKSPEQFLRIIIAALVGLGLSGCITRRTVSEGGSVVSSGYVIKRPLQD